MILFQFVISGRRFIISDVGGEPLYAWKSILNGYILILLLALGLVRNAGTRVEVLVRWRQLGLHTIEISDVSRVLSSNLTSGVLMVVSQVLRQHRAVKTAQAIAEGHVVRKVLPPFD